MRGVREYAPGRLLVSTFFPGALTVLVLVTTGCENRLARMEDNQVRLQAMVAANARQLATISSQVYVNNNEVQAGIQKLDRNDTDLATGISTVQTKQDALHETVTAASQTLDKRMASLDENQRHLQDGVLEIANVTEKTASDVTAITKEQQILHQTVQNSRKELGDGITAVAVNQEKTRADIGQLQQTDQRVVEQLVALASSQDRIHANLDGMDKRIQAVAGDVTAVSRSQAAFHQALNEHNATFASQAAVLEQNQRTMQASVDGIAGQTNRNGEGVTAIAAQQNTLQQTLGANHKAMTSQVAAVIENQHAIQADVRGLTDKAGQATSQLADGQRQMQDQLDVLTSTTGQTALDIAALSDNSAAIRQAIQSGTTGLAERTEQIATSLTNVADRQTAMQQAIDSSNTAFSGRADKLTSAQEALRGQLDVLATTTGRTATDVVALGDREAKWQQTAQAEIARLNEQANRIGMNLNTVATEQSAAHKTLREQGEQLSSRFMVSVEKQQQLQGDVDALLATTGQTALDVITLASGQDALQRMVQDHDKTLNRQIADFGAGQEQVQNTLDTVTATSGQTALDVIALNEGQTRMAQAAQADRQELVTRLTGIVENQQQWLQRLDTAQTNVQTVAATIATIEQHIVKLQDAVKPSLDGLATQLGTSGQSRAQFEARVNQDIQRMIDAVSELRQDQASLVDQMEQIQKRTQTQTNDIITAIQQLKQPPAELKVSNSGVSESPVTLSDSGTTLESSVAEAAAQ